MQQNASIVTRFKHAESPFVLALLTLKFGMKQRRRKPARWLGYMPGSVRGLARDGFKTVTVHCVGTQPIKRGCRYHQKRFRLDELPGRNMGGPGPVERAFP